ncbi:TPA: recombinase family protein [Vibrio parahaemolyticus]|nr:recombinase family protein [Vibrio parahaemolyticus]
MIHFNEISTVTAKTYIYARVSTKHQNVQQQIDVLAKKYKHDAVFSDNGISGKTLERPSFNELREIVKANDSIVVLDLSRIGRNTQEVLEFIEEMTSRKVHVRIDDMGSVDVTSSTGKMVITTLAAVATMQREQMLEKQAIGIDRAKSEGKFRGKQQTQATIDKCEEALSYIANGMSKKKAAKAAEIGIATLYRYIKENKIDL